MKSIKNQKSKNKRFGTLFRSGWVNGRLALFLAVCGLAVASCGHIRYIPVAGETIIKDSIIYEERIDTAWITLPPVKVKDYSALKDTLRLDGVYEVAWAAVDEGKEMLVGGIETTKEKIPTQVIYKTKTEYRDSTVYKEIPIEIEKERIVKVYPKGLVILSILGTISILVLIFILYIKIKRKLSPIG